MRKSVDFPSHQFGLLDIVQWMDSSPAQQLQIKCRMIGYLTLAPVGFVRKAVS